jgi:cytochrome b
MARATSPVWDWPVRLVHWALVLLLPTAWYLAENGMLQWHRRTGYTIAMLLIFRLLWGVFGSETARFSSFVRGPRAVISYARAKLFDRDASVEPGHNPLGAWSVVAILLLLIIQIGLGLFATDLDGLESGPLSYLIDFETSRKIANLHGLMFNLILATVAIHVVAILFYLVYKRQNLIGPMIAGGRHVAATRPRWWVAPLLFVASMAAVSTFIRIFGT